MLESITSLQPLAWPFALAFTWMAGEVVHRWTHLPRISVYGLAGFFFGNVVPDVLTAPQLELLLVTANIAFGLMLFELGYRINLAWLKDNPWIAVTGIAESLLTFVVVGVIAHGAGQSPLASLLLATLAMSTSPASVVRVVNEEGAAGQVSERLLHLTAINCVLAACLFKIVLGVSLYQNTGSWLSASWHSMVVLLTSAGLGGTFGVIVPAWLRRMGRLSIDGTAAFAIGVLLLVAVSHVLKLSPIVATLVFGLVARHRRISLSRAQRNFGLLGDLLTVLLFFYVGATISWSLALSGAGLGVMLVCARIGVKTAVVGALARPSGISLRKGTLTGLALAPMSVFALLLLEQTRHLGLDLVDQLNALAAMAIMLEVAGPVLTQIALRRAQESHFGRKE